MESFIQQSGNIFIISIILVLILLTLIYQSKLEKLKRFTTMLLIGFFSWSIGKDDYNKLMLFLIGMGFVLYIWNKKDTEEKSKKSQKLINYNNNMNKFGKYLENNPLNVEEIRHTSKLPFNKEQFIKDSVVCIRLLESEEQNILLNGVPLIAYFRDDISEDGYTSNISELVNIDDLSNIINKENDFPTEIYKKCNEESEWILKMLQKSISIK